MRQAGAGLDHQSLAGACLLLIESDGRWRREIRAALAEAGATVISAASARLALGAIAGDAFDGALLGLSLGGKNADLIAVRLIASGIPFVRCIVHPQRHLLDDRRGHSIVVAPGCGSELIEAVINLLGGPERDIPDAVAAQD